MEQTGENFGGPSRFPEEQAFYYLNNMHFSWSIFSIACVRLRAKAVHHWYQSAKCFLAATWTSLVCSATLGTLDRNFEASVGQSTLSDHILEFWLESWFAESLMSTLVVLPARVGLESRNPASLTLCVYIYPSPQSLKQRQVLGLCLLHVGVELPGGVLIQY